MGDMDTPVHLTHPEVAKSSPQSPVDTTQNRLVRCCGAFVCHVLQENMDSGGGDTVTDGGAQRELTGLAGQRVAVWLMEFFVVEGPHATRDDEGVRDNDKRVAPE